MAQSTKIGIIGAGGWLGRAFAQAAVDSGFVIANQLVLSYRSRKPEFLEAAFWTADNQQLVDRSDVVLVSVRPEDFGAIRVETSGKLIVSVMAGVTLADLADRFSTTRVVRTLPNAGAGVRCSYTPWVAAEGLHDEDCRLVEGLLSTCGTADRVHDEATLDYFTGLSGSGPALPALLASAMEADAISQGIDPGSARRAVLAVLVGAGRLAELQGECPNKTVKTFLDYRGTTAAAIETMRDRGFDVIVSAGLQAAYSKSMEMGRAQQEA